MGKLFMQVFQVLERIIVLTIFQAIIKDRETQFVSLFR